MNRIIRQDDEEYMHQVKIDAMKNIATGPDKISKLFEEWKKRRTFKSCPNAGEPANQN